MDDWEDGPSAGSNEVSAPEGMNRRRVFGGRGRVVAPAAAENRPGGKSYKRVCVHVRVQCKKGPRS